MHGILMGWPLAPLTAPSQSPVPVGFTPAENPNWGMSDESTPPAAGAAAATAGDAAGAAAAAGDAATGAGVPF